MIVIFRILSYLLLLAGAFLLFTTLAGLFLALANPAALLPVFLTGATVIYIATSFYFLLRVIDGQGTLRATLKDWIRVNAFVALFFSALMLLQSIVLLQNPGLLHEALEQAVQQASWPGAESADATLAKSIRVVLIAMAVLAIMVQVHVFLCFRLLRTFAERFI